jgi:hypothetical protein
MNPRKLLLAIILYSLGPTTYAQNGLVSHQVEEALVTGTFREISPFSPDVISSSTDSLISEVLTKGTILNPDTFIISELLRTSPENVRLTIPQFNKPPIILDLVKSTPFAEGFQVFAASDRTRPLEIETGLYYKGIISGQPSSLAAISIFNGEIRGLIGTNSGNMVLGKRKNNKNSSHILYNDQNLKVSSNFSCGVEDLPHPPRNPKTHRPTNPTRATSNCVNVYVEVDHDIFLDLGTVEACYSYMAGLFNESYVLFSNDTISVAMSEMVIWDNPSPYNCTTSLECLVQFRDELGTNFNGDLGHLVNYVQDGGRAYLSALCDDIYNKGYSGLNGYFYPVPTYSWDVMVFTHEIGHNLGSEHTHDCVWNGDNTAIDGCGPTAGAPSSPGGCSTGPIPANGGTIMSYCHLLNSVGINLNLGFHPQVRSLIHSEINNASCLGNCNGFVDTFYCYSQGLVPIYLWTAGVQIGSFSNTSSYDYYTDFTNLTIPVEKGVSTPFTLTPSYDAGGPYNTFFKIYIDLNKDNDFEDAGEEVFSTPNPVYGATSGSITIPDSISLGTTRLRVIVNNVSITSACEQFVFGEVEDYTIDIQSPGYCNAQSIDSSFMWIAGSVPVTIVPGFDANGPYLCNYRIWIDWNGDLDFTDAGEEVLAEDNLLGGFSSAIAIPDTSLAGERRMRIMLNNFPINSPCGSFSFGEVEDYTITINQYDCSGGDTLAPLAVCRNLTATLYSLLQFQRIHLHVTILVR